ncbi:hypothetical protein PY650_35115 [Rhizobium calliandrae]|uniref:Antifreeze protein n=1 Tax=Rhizobium calliandrae TaxID=1312182 RepID=A0ABT7KPZ9_9HYPH|nr:hypothetical protein [Rhizobium calliandrae]MDL2410697.1 hypothetical protein [Rhizobium calliandrae]
MFGRVAGISYIALAGLAVSQLLPTVAMAQYYDDNHDYYRPRHDQYYDHSHGDWGGCSRHELMAAARDEGFRRIDSVQMNGRRIIVRGWNDGGPDRMAFANRPGCPVLD